MIAIRNRKFTLWVTVIVLVVLGLMVTPNLGQSAPDPVQVAFNQTNLIRLHVVANSDSIVDQGLKLRVRDAILLATGELLQDIVDANTAWDILASNLDFLKATATQQILAEGQNHSVQIELGQYSFPSKAYGNFVLAAGTYPALRVTIGKGDGHNWWCVLFPPLCFLNMSGPIASERIQKEPQPATSDENKVSLEFSSPFGLPVSQIPVVTPGFKR